MKRKKRQLTKPHNKKTQIIALIKTTFFTLIALTLISASFFYAYEQFREEKNQYIADNNQAFLKSITENVNKELNIRLQDLKKVVPRIFGPTANSQWQADIFKGLPSYLKEEVLSAAIMEKTKDGKLKIVGHYRNKMLLDSQNLQNNVLSTIYERHPLPLKDFFKSPQAKIINRSIRLNSLRNNNNLPVITFLLPTNFLNDSKKDLAIAVDFLQNFLQRILFEPEISTAFLIFSDGKLLSHSDSLQIAEYSRNYFAHPILKHLKKPRLENTFQATISDIQYEIDYKKNHHGMLYTVIQTDINNPTLIEKVLMKNRLIVAVPILLLVTIVFLFIISRFISKRRKSKEQSHLSRAEQTKSNEATQPTQQAIEFPPEFQSLLDQLITLAGLSPDEKPPKEAIEFSEQLLNSLGKPPKANSEVCHLASYYKSYGSLKKDFWHVDAEENILTIYLGSIEGQDINPLVLQAATAIFYSSLSHIHKISSLTPEKIFQLFNNALFISFGGRLRMDFCLSQLDVENGDLLMFNAGHNNPLVLHIKEVSPENKLSDKTQKMCEEIKCAQNEPLGITMEAKFLTEKYQLSPSDIALFYSQGIQNAPNKKTVPFGKQNLINTFSKADPESLLNTKTLLVKELKLHTDDSPSQNDMTFILLSWMSNTKPTTESLPQTENTTPALIQEAKQTTLLKFNALVEDKDRRQEFLYPDEAFDEEGDPINIEDNTLNKKTA